MEFSVEDHVRDALNVIWASVPEEPDDKGLFTCEAVQSGHFVFDRSVDQAVVEREIREFHKVYARLRAEANLAEDFGYVPNAYAVLPDGRWHPDDFQAYLMQEDEPHLTPREWVERHIAIRLRTR